MLDKENGKSNLIGVVALVIAAMLWGGEYAVAKDVLDVMPPNWINMIRTAVSAIIGLIVWRKAFKSAKLIDWGRGAFTGIFFGLGFATQTMGLETVNAGINAFLSSAYVILVPFMVWVVAKARPYRNVFIAAVIGIIGISTMSVTGFSTGELSIGPGELLSLLSAVFYAFAMVSLDIFTEKTDVGFLTGCQFIFTFIVAFVFAMITEQPPAVDVDGVIVAEFIYLIFLGTFATQLLFTFGIKYASATQAGVIFPLESVSATALGCLFLGEVLEGVHIVGGILLVIAIIISSLEPKKKEEQLPAGGSGQ